MNIDEIMGFLQLGDIGTGLPVCGNVINAELHSYGIGFHMVIKANKFLFFFSQNKRFLVSRSGNWPGPKFVGMNSSLQMFFIFQYLNM